VAQLLRGIDTSVRLATITSFVSRIGDKLESILHRYIEGDNAFMAIHKQEFKIRYGIPEI